MKLWLTILFAGIQLTAFAQDLESIIAAAEKKDRAMDTQSALALYLQAEKIAPQNPKVLIGIAKQYGESMVDTSDKKTKIKRGETALAYAMKALSANPKYSDSHLAVAICYGRLMDYVGTKTQVEYSRLVKSHADKAIELNPRSDYAWHLLGRWHRGVADISPFAKGLAKVVYGGIPNGTNAEAVAAFRKAIELNPNRVVHYIELGIALIAIGKVTEGKAAIEKGLSMPVRERDDPASKQRGKDALAGVN